MDDLLIENTTVYGHEPSRIHGGEDSKEGEFKFFVSLAKNRTLLCGGAIVDERHVITAAHCFANFTQTKINKTVVISGITDFQIGGKKHSIEKIFSHPNFDETNPTSTNDIAIVKTKQKIQLGDNQPKSAPARSVALASGPIESGKNVTAIGFGMTESQPNSLSKTLKKISVRTLAISKCQKCLNNKLGDGQFCTISPIGKGTCVGDSGGPVINSEGKLVGIISWGLLYALGDPDIHTNVSYYMDWITNIIN
ncbi:mite allergen Der p 3-like [Cotesia typhae]|uniref:mite allergen Der p 3-like n=1 Tax=Cotesia typhae TaxID=2053667 RepID=UPI003D683B11